MIGVTLAQAALESQNSERAYNGGIQVVVVRYLGAVARGP
jgi:hypothetical protein